MITSGPRSPHPSGPQVLMSNKPDRLKAPFPWFGGKSRAADLIWPRLGDVPNYVEPFAGSLAVLLARPHAPGNEIVNDLDCYVANAWRAVKLAPAEVAAHCDWPVNEADLHARHQWLHGRAEFRERMKLEPDFYDPRIAGFWIWGLSSWIGDAFCRPKCGSTPHLSGGKGVARKVPHLTSGKGVARKVPCLMNAQKGVHRKLGVSPGEATAPAVGSPESENGAGRGAASAAEDSLTSEAGPREGRGAESAGLISQQMPAVTGCYGARENNGQPHGRGTVPKQTEALLAWFDELAARLRFTKVCCGDWARVVTKASTYGQGLTGVLLDPPYDAGDSHDDVYGDLSRGVSARVREWAIENGSNPLLRIALCGYEGEHAMPADWSCVAWKAVGGYGNQSGNENAKRERIWFSPHCLQPQAELFDFTAA
jgi:hypothetical protein